MAKKETKDFQVRLPIFLYEKLEERRKKNLRSLNSEIIISLREYLFVNEDGAWSAEDLKNFLFLKTQEANRYYGTELEMIDPEFEKDGEEENPPKASSE
jgi:hypothetical protein